MARPHRIDLPGGWYHVMSRGIDRRLLFLEDCDCLHFLGLLEEMVERYNVEVHCYVLMGNHYHLLMRTPHANLSRAMQWLNVSHGVWFNRRHPRVGPLFQGRFKSVPIDGEGTWALQASVYVHLNPVRVKGLGLGKRGRKAEGLGISPPPPPELVEARVKALKRHRWSSYPAYAGYASRPDWLTCEDLWRRAKHDGLSETLSYRRQVEESLTGGLNEVDSLGKQLAGVLAVGSSAFLDKLRRGVRGNRSEQKAIRAWRRLLPFDRVVELVAQEKREPWEKFRDRRGDSGRDLALWLGRKHCGLTLAELGYAAGGMSYSAVSMAVHRFDAQRKTDASVRVLLNRIEAHLCNVQT